MCVDTSTTNDSGKYGRRCHFLLLARTALEVGVDNRVTDGRARSLELNARGVHVPDVIAVSPDGGGCRRCSKDSGAGVFGGSGGVAASIVGGHAELQNIKWILGGRSCFLLFFFAWIVTGRVPPKRSELAMLTRSFGSVIHAVRT